MLWVPYLVPSSKSFWRDWWHPAKSCLCVRASPLYIFHSG